MRRLAAMQILRDSLSYPIRGSGKYLLFSDIETIESISTDFPGSIHKVFPFP
jgi:hypothetical protein